mmetsp:Transcript_12300/g.28410  ORF Transcript_12300/g.28410 Transcript_12300/m.28410 type:complete len:318 (-) Transcript_12300:51-1004(-)
MLSRHLTLLSLVACIVVGVCSRGQTDRQATPSDRLAADKPREAYVTLVTTPTYVIGAEVLAKCLRHVGATRDILVLVGPLVGRDDEKRLKAAGLIPTRVDDVETSEILELLDRPYFNTTFNKLHVFGLYDNYDKVVFLDADLLILKNIDELFELDLSTGYPFAAAPEIMPPDTFNTGVLVVAPSEKTYHELLQAARSMQSPDGSDQGFLNQFYPRWFEQDSSHRLPFVYNALQTVASYYNPAWEMLKDNMKVLHFAGDDLMKPWSFEGSLPPSLGVFLFLWQSIARTPAGGDIGQHFKVLNLTDPEEINALFKNRMR